MRNLLILFFSSLTLLHASTGVSQGITISVKEARLESVFTLIQQQSPYRFVYTSEKLGDSKKVTVSVKNAAIEKLLELIFKDQPVSYNLEGQTIVIYRKEKSVLPQQHAGVVITGKVINEKGAGIPSVTISIKSGTVATATDEKGNFVLKDIDPLSDLMVSSIGYETRQASLAGRSSIVIQLIQSVSALDETVVKGYYSTTRRLNTGNVGKITAEQIAEQPVSNPLAALEGRIPGLVVTQSSGIPGASYKIQLRGQNSISKGNDPFIIIDGVPFAPNNTSINQIAAAFSNNGSGLSPFSGINPDDIESIEVLKDADATAIYGSRGANGVILITTKKGKAGETKLDLNAYHGNSVITRKVQMLTTPQYLRMRREAFANDNTSPTNSNAYDLLLWDTTRYTDWSKTLVGGTAHTTDLQASIAGGSTGTQFLVSGSFHDESTVYPGDMSDRRGAFHFNANHHSNNNKFSIALTGNYTIDNNDIISADLTNYINAIPTLPSLHDANGNLKFSEAGRSYSNPLSYLLRKYTDRIDNLLGNLQLSYLLGYGFTAKVNTGFNAMNIHELHLTPIAAQNPANNPTGTSEFADNHFTSLIIEPQLDYQLTGKNGKLNLLFGGTWQRNQTNGNYIFASGYTNDALLQTVAGAASVLPSTSAADYKYAAGFLRAGYNYKNKYLLNFTGRRDGSSRFGPGKQFANFGAIGVGWLFSNESFFEKQQALSYGKIRGSYGTTGNDAIGDYDYLSTYGPTLYPYQGIPGLVPRGLFNADYNWEINKKLELALETGWFHDRLLFNIAWYDNRSSNQLVAYSLPAQTGFTSITRNFPAVVKNTGVELELSSAIIADKNFKWQSAFSITIPVNKLVSYPGLSTSSYRNTYAIGKSLQLGNGFVLNGVDPQTGIYTFLTGKGQTTSSPVYPDDYVIGLVTLAPKYYGAFDNTVNFQHFQLSVFFEFRKQMGRSLFADAQTGAGTVYNQPDAVLARWQKPGDITTIQKYTASFNSPAYQALNSINNNGADRLYADASFIRLKNIALSYNINPALLKKIHLSAVSLFCQAQNLFNITGYKGADPESQSTYTLPPLRTIAAGIHVTL